jgi:hypothetical protein
MNLCELIGAQLFRAHCTGRRLVQLVSILFLSFFTFTTCSSECAPVAKKNLTHTRIDAVGVRGDPISYNLLGCWCSDEQCAFTTDRPSHSSAFTPDSACQKHTKCIRDSAGDLHRRQAVSSLLYDFADLEAISENNQIDPIMWLFRLER